MSDERSNSTDQDAPDPTRAAPSRSARKREAERLQKLGESLTALGAAQLKALALPEILHDAILAYQAMSANGARRRQRQYIGAMMRDLRELDPQSISATLATLDGQSALARYQHHALEQWRERLLAGDEAVSEFIDQFGSVDRQRLRQLVLAARREQTLAEAPRPAARKLFRFLKQVQDENQEA